MKTSINYKLVLLIMFGVTSCKMPTQEYTILSGKIINHIDDHLYIINMLTNQIDTIQLSDDGSFNQTFNSQESMHLIKHGKMFRRIYFGNGKNLGFTLDMKSSNRPNFTGGWATVNHYYLDIARKKNGMIGEKTSNYKLSEAAFKEKMLRVEKEMLKLLDANKNLSQEFKSKESRNISYFFLAGFYAYKRFNSDTTTIDQVLPKGFDLNNAKDYFYSDAYRGMLESYHSQQAKSISQSENLSDDIALLTSLSRIQNDSIKNYMLYNRAKKSLSRTDDLDLYYNTYKRFSTNENQKQEIKEKYLKLKTTIASGRPSPKFYDYENYSGGKTSLSDLRGKYLYIDVWATWCAPCKKEIPFLNALEKNYHDKNIEFVSISIDKLSDRDKWFKMINDKQMGGVQLLADNAWQSQFVKDYQINSIPRFILLDPEGIILTANAPRPSDDKRIKKLLDSLLITG